MAETHVVLLRGINVGGKNKVPMGELRRCLEGLGFANVLREMELPRRALGWSLFSFNIGVEIGQLFVVVLVATAFTVLRQRSEWSRRHLAVAGSIVVIAAGAFWFVQRVFFPGGLS